MALIEYDEYKQKLTALEPELEKLSAALDLEAAKAEFRQRTAGGYTCPIPPDAVPAPLEL